VIIHFYLEERMLTLENYKSQNGMVKQFNEKALELDKVGESFTSKRVDNHTWIMDNCSETTLNAYAVQALKSGKLPSTTKTFTQSDLSYWTISQGVVKKQSTISHKAHQLATQNEVISQNVTKEEFNRWDQTCQRFKITSSNIPHLPYPDVYRGYDVVKYFRDAIQSTAPHLVEFMSTEWRYEGIHLYKEDQVKFVHEQLSAKGFAVDFQPPYIIVDKERYSGEMCINARQSISVRIPKESTIKEDAVYENHNTYKETLSVHNALVAWRDTPNKISLSDNVSNSKVTVEEVLEQISKELTFIASQGSMIKRYAFRVEELDSSKQQKLLEQLRGLGYQVTLDAQFIYQQFVGLANGFHEQFSRQYVLIDLP
jgi:hypothetical protein